MPVLLNWGFNFLLGWAAVMLTRRHQELRQSALGWILLILVVFEAVVFTPLAIYLFRFFPYWSTHYLIDPDIYPRLNYWAFAISALVVAGNFLSLIFSYFVSRALVVREHGALAFLMGVIGLAVCVFDITYYWPRLSRLSDYKVFWAGGGEFTFSQPVGILSIALYLSCIILLVVLQRMYGKPAPHQ